MDVSPLDEVLTQVEQAEARTRNQDKDTETTPKKHWTSTTHRTRKGERKRCLHYTQNIFSKNTHANLISYTDPDISLVESDPEMKSDTEAESVIGPIRRKRGRGRGTGRGGGNIRKPGPSKQAIETPPPPSTAEAESDVRQPPTPAGYGQTVSQYTKTKFLSNNQRYILSNHRSPGQQ